jgi:ribosomal protein L1
MFPSRKNGMLCSEREMIEKIHSFELGERDIKTDKGGNIHGLLGTSDLSVKQLEENYFKFKSEVNSIRPSNWKGEFLISSVISTNSGPGVKISTK